VPEPGTATARKIGAHCEDGTCPSCPSARCRENPPWPVSVSLASHAESIDFSLDLFIREVCPRHLKNSGQVQAISDVGLARWQVNLRFQLNHTCHDRGSVRIAVFSRSSIAPDPPRRPVPHGAHSVLRSFDGTVATRDESEFCFHRLQVGVAAGSVHNGVKVLCTDRTPADGKAKIWSVGCAIHNNLVKDTGVPACDESIPPSP